MFSLIAAVDRYGGISHNNAIPWYSKLDLQFFKKTTMGSMVIMGSKTWQSLPIKPLPGRINIVISSRLHDKNNAINKPDYIFKSVYDFIVWIDSKQIKEKYNTYNKFIIGGAQLYNTFIDMNIIEQYYISHINAVYDCDKFINIQKFINLPSTQLDAFNDNGLDITIIKYKYINYEEKAVLDLILSIQANGAIKINRNGYSYSLFGNQLTFSLRSNRFPLLTSRRLPLRHIFEELMWILRGQTDNKILTNKKVHIWTPNSTREFLDDRGLTHLQEGDIGSTYGFQLRHFGAEYKGCDINYAGCGFDQLVYVINLIKNNPDDRRIIISLWNPIDLDKMSLPACLYNYQFYVANGYLSCKVTQRSSDIVLAGGWNIAFASLFTILLADICNLNPDKLIWSLGDVHIYNNQLDLIDILSAREPRPFPLLFIKHHHAQITDYEYSDLALIGYNPYDNFKVSFNV